MDQDDLSEAERSLWQAFPRGAWVDLRTGDPGADDLAKADAWGEERSVRAEVIAALLLGAGTAEPGYRPALRLRGARITGRLDLMGATVEHPLVCEHCRFDEPLRFVESVTRTVRIVASVLPAFNGARMRTEGIINFRDCEVEAGVRLDRAKIVGEVTFWGASLGPDADGVALAADGMAVEGPVQCSAGFAARGSVLLHGSRVEGELNFTDATLVNPGGTALGANRLVVSGPLRADNLVTEGETRLINADIAGDLLLNGARLRDPGGFALSCGGMVIHGGVWCGKGFAAEGEMRFIGAQLRATLSLRGAELSNPGGDALKLDRASLGELHGAGLTVRGGQVSLIGTNVTGHLNLERARLGADGDHDSKGEGEREGDCVDDETAIWLEGVTIGGILRLTWLRTVGEVRIRGCVIHGRVLLMHSWLEGTDEVALRFTRNEVDTDVVCDDLVTIGEARFVDSRIGRHLDLDQVCLVNPGGVALDARMVRATEMSLLPGQPIQGLVILEHARIGLLRDDPAAWPAQMRLDGLMYESLQPALPARRRLDWLARDAHGYQPQPYEQLAAHYTRTGQPVEARRVLYAREHRQRQTKPFLGRLWGVLQDVTVAYGYQPWRPLMWLALLLAVGTVTYGISPPSALTDGDAPHFNPMIYTLDLLLPIVDLGQEHAFNPAGAAQWFSYFLIAAGWILATTIAAGVARTLSRR
ncbi:MAG TPA: hypothetical protein VFU43_11045 [Streptosporangiaceae bacterium]|nr:hypothetical protein [Streptosporangiaceae bacterium]